MQYSRFFLLGTLFSIISCTLQPTLEVPEAYQAGQKYFHQTCANCHGSDAMGKQTKAPRLIDEDYLANNFSDDEIREAVINGTDKMPSQKAKVSGEEITEIIKYLRYSQSAAGLSAENEDDIESEESES